MEIYMTAFSSLEQYLDEPDFFIVPEYMLTYHLLRKNVHVNIRLLMRFGGNRLHPDRKLEEMKYR